MKNQIRTKNQWPKKYRVSGYYYEDFTHSYPRAEAMAKNISAVTDRWGKIEVKKSIKNKIKKFQIFFCYHLKKGFDYDYKVIPKSR